MSGTAIIQHPARWVEACHKDAGQRRLHPAELAIDAGHDGVRFRRRGGVHTDQSHQARGPHARRQPFPADVAERQNQPAARLLDGKEITRQVPDGKDLTRNLEVAAPHQAGGAEASVHLRSLEECGVKIAILFLECRELRQQLFLARLAGCIAR